VKIARITLVEDNPADVLLLKMALQEKGIPFELTCFEDGEEALKHLSREERDEPDIILLDLNLPMTEGVEVLRRLRSIPKLVNVPVAILSSSASPMDVNRAKSLGVDRYISKPIALDDFLREVGREIEEMLGGQ
jgi:chemotaxis family two-component system response regulator Rcp1